MAIYCGVYFHARQQTVCYCDTADGGVRLKELDHEGDDVGDFYADLAGEVTVGIEASSYRHKVVKHTTMVKNSLRAIALGVGVSIRGRPTSKAGLERLRAIELPALLAAERDEWLRLLAQLEEQRKAVEQQLLASAKDRPARAVC